MALLGLDLDRSPVRREDTPPTSSAASPPETVGDTVKSTAIGSDSRQVASWKDAARGNTTVSCMGAKRTKSYGDYYKGNALQQLLNATEYFVGNVGDRRQRRKLETRETQKEMSPRKRKQTIQSETSAGKKSDKKSTDRRKQIEKHSEPKAPIKSEQEQSGEHDGCSPWFLSHEMSENVKITWNFFDPEAGNKPKELELISAYTLVNDRLDRYVMKNPQITPREVYLMYPLFDYQEKYLLAECKLNAWFNPIADIARVMELTATVYMPEKARKKVINFDNPSNCLIKRWDDAVNRHDGNQLVQLVEEYNSLVAKLRKNGEIIQHIRQRKTFPQLLVHEIMNQCYLRGVLPDYRKLRSYKAFSNYVYGELMPSFLSRAFNQCKLSHTKVFIDLGSGVGNCTIQAALEYGCESYGVEIMDHASRLCMLQTEEFEKRCAIWGVRHGAMKFFLGESFVDNAPVQEVIDRSDVILVNNYLFDAELSKKVVDLFSNLKTGTQIISLKPIVPPGYTISWGHPESILSRMKCTRYTYGENDVSWTSKGGFYYITEVLPHINEEYLRALPARSQRTRGKELVLNAFTNNV
ncbi:hypothetical protein KL907_004347 [Ogataea polymorpha]|nr:hypothetical protein KL907_004347 [Ogataea polymorpha]KAG7914825.1 hypothetical protein KL927_004494 [Ogataea polymorpha]KAG7931244.1 hypothetical protein KL934_004365 [Ogataea polymorpha]